MGFHVLKGEEFTSEEAMEEEILKYVTKRVSRGQVYLNRLDSYKEPEHVKEKVILIFKSSYMGIKGSEASDYREVLRVKFKSEEEYQKAIQDMMAEMHAKGYERVGRESINTVSVLDSGTRVGFRKVGMGDKGYGG